MSGKRKRIKVEAYNGVYGSFGSSSSNNYAFVSSPSKGRRQCHVTLACRDHLHEVVRAHVHKDGKGELLPGIYVWGKQPPLDVEKTRLLITASPSASSSQAKTHKNRLFKGKATVNLCERIAGWEESKISSVEWGPDSAPRAWLLTGPKDWMRHPCLLSTLTLVLRLPVALNLEVPEGEEGISKWARDVDPVDDRPGTYSHYAVVCSEKLATVMRNEKLLFDKGIEESYLLPKQVDRISGGDKTFHAFAGIASLCSFNSLHLEAEEKLKKLLKLK
jgi:hypothetical protein